MVVSSLDLDPVGLAYLLRRGYTRDIIRNEGIQTIGPGQHFIDELSSPLSTQVGLLLFTCKSMSGEIAGIHTASWEKKEYRYFPTVSKAHLPIMYASEEDYNLMYSSQIVVLTEGVFDRVAIKRCVPGVAVFARLSKGTSGYLSILLRRYAKRVILAFDQDAAGKIGTDKAETRIAGGIEVCRLDLPAKDPAHLLETKGLNVASRLINSRLDSLTL